MPGGLTATEHFERLGILDDRLQLIHMIRTTAHEVPLLARAGTHVVHCPAASLRVGMGVSRVGVFPEMVEAGVNVALGSDSGNYSDFYDVGRQMYLAATIHREARGVMPTITAEQAIEMATINGARAIGAGEWLGSLEAGKQADLVIHRWDRPGVAAGRRSRQFARLQRAVERRSTRSSWAAKSSSKAGASPASTRRPSSPASTPRRGR